MMMNAAGDKKGDWLVLSFGYIVLWRSDRKFWSVGVLDAVGGPSMLHSITQIQEIAQGKKWMHRSTMIHQPKLDN